VDRLTGQQLGNYHILDQIGQGGMTTVYKAIDSLRNETVAVKVLSPYIAQDPKFKSRFKREIDLLLELKHPNIVPVLDYGEEDGIAYIVMPFMPRGTLYNRLEAGPLTPQEGIKLIDEIAAGLQFAHDRGIVHRDVKPSNILLSDEGRALLSDFGFAHVGDLTGSLTGSALIGTPAYMSPEQCQGHAITSRSDQYSLGILLYQICTGTLPFSGDTPMAVAVQQINQPVPKARGINPRIPEDLDRLLNKVLSKKPERRYDSVSELAQEFRRTVEASFDEAGNFIPQPERFDISTWIIERSPIAGPIGWVRRAWNWRYRTAVLATLFLFLLPAGGFALAAFQPTSKGGQAGPIGMTQAEYQATIMALYTQVAGAGPGLDDAAIAAMVQATVRAMAMVEPNSTDSVLTAATPTLQATPTPTPEFPGSPSAPASTMMLVGQPGQGGNGGGGSSPTATSLQPSATSSGGGGATNTPVPQPSPTSLSPSNTPAPPSPSDTPAPQPTNTPAGPHCYDGKHGNKDWPPCPDTPTP
jgi:serine/threonine protein kinase